MFPWTYLIVEHILQPLQTLQRSKKNVLIADREIVRRKTYWPSYEVELDWVKILTMPAVKTWDGLYRLGSNMSEQYRRTNTGDYVASEST